MWCNQTITLWWYEICYRNSYYNAQYWYDWDTNSTYWFINDWTANDWIVSDTMQNWLISNWDWALYDWNFAIKTDWTWPCSDWFRLPTKDELDTIVTWFIYNSTTKTWNHSSGLQFQLSGLRIADGNYYNQGTDTSYWSSSSGANPGTYAWSQKFSTSDEYIFNLFLKNNSFPVRCIKNPIN